MKYLLTALMFTLAPLAAQAKSDSPAPVAVVEEAAELLDQALDKRQDELEKDKEALYELIDEILLPRFDRRYAAQLVLGRHWRTASDAQREQFIEAFYKSLLRKYADGVLEFDLAQLEIRPFRGDLSKPRTVVQTMVKLDDGTEVPVDYSLVKRPKGWLIFDVQIEGISYVRNFRAEFNSEIQATGLEKVIARLQSEAAAAGEEADEGSASE